VRLAFFAHSWRSDWNHGNAHFLRGLFGALTAGGHVVRTFEPADAWSARELIADRGEAAASAYREAYPALQPELFDEATLDLDAALDEAEVVVVHEWTSPALVARIGRHRRAGGAYTLLFHDTHHRSVSSPHDLARLPLDDYDGVLAFGETVRERYVQAGWSSRVWTWHEAADVRVFGPQPPPAERSDLVFIGNWGDDERTAELDTFLLRPARRLGLTGHVHGVRYPPRGVEAVQAAGLIYMGYAPNHHAPAVFARHRVTVHVPRAPYARALAGVPTIRMFEALACGIPLVSAPWTDSEGLFRAGLDYLSANDEETMTRQLNAVLHEPGLAESLAASGLETIATRHTCDHRAGELLRIVASLRGCPAREVVA
jgi:spore maturation protein CgeB